MSHYITKLWVWCHERIWSYVEGTGKSQHENNETQNCECTFKRTSTSSLKANLPALCVKRLNVSHRSAGRGPWQRRGLYRVERTPKSRHKTQTQRFYGMFAFKFFVEIFGYVARSIRSSQEILHPYFTFQVPQLQLIVKFETVMSIKTSAV